MNITHVDKFLIGRLHDRMLSEKEQIKLIAMANDETVEELMNLIEEAQSLADPIVLFGVCSVTRDAGGTVRVNEVPIESVLVEEKLFDKNLCFPYIASCGTALEEWSTKYKTDPLAEYWTDAIKKQYLLRITARFFSYLKEHYQMAGHLTALNPGSLKQWPIAGQRELFSVLGGAAFIEEKIGVSCTECFLILPTKSISGIVFESDSFYENCQYCPQTDCPDRRAVPKTEEGTTCIR